MRLPVLILCLCLASALAADDSPQAQPAHGLSLPAGFAGDLPCADCEAIRTRLDLWPGQAFHFSREWLGGDAPLKEDALGRWALDPSREALVLHGMSGVVAEFEIKDADTLRLMGRDGAPIVSDLPYDLSRTAAFEPAPVAGRMIGEFVYFADAGVFTPCATGRSHPVAMQGDYLALESAYLEARAEPMAPVVAVIDGGIAMRKGMEGGPVQTVTVDRLVGIWPDLTCDRARADAALENTYWRIEALGDMRVEAEADRREPHLLLRPEEGRFAATVGCNQLLGGYESGGNELSFQPGPMTLMACPPPLDSAEEAMVRTLQAVAGYRITGPTMELTDASGAPLARLQAIYLP